MKKQILITVVAALMLVPAGAFASGDHGDHGKKTMSHGEHGKKMGMDKGEKMGMDHGKKMGHEGMDHGGKKMGHEGMDHGGMKMDGKMIMLQTQEIEGVKASAHLSDVREEMAKHGMKETHHIMVNFNNPKSGDNITEGQVAVKIESPDGKVHDAITMMGMDGHFGVDITLDQKGEYHFKVGTKLADGVKRVFHFHHEN